MKAQRLKLLEEMGSLVQADAAIVNALRQSVAKRCERRRILS